MKKILTVKAPSFRELLTLRLMIFLGLLAMLFFMSSILEETVRGNTLLYILLLATFSFTCLKIIHEWCHYLFITVPKTPVSSRIYSVDIFTTFCAGEPYAMIEETLRAIQDITYPHNTYLCDESDDQFLKKLCNELGVIHVTRVEKIDAKAGNINNALRQSNGELCVVLDPDHVPEPCFLDPIVAHFEDPKVGYVQIVQAYKNNNEGLIAKGAAQQTYQFYGPMMMTMNKYGTVLAIGANCTFRRTALESIGGHAAGLAEDMHTSMQLHARGWTSVYLPVVLARGLVPSTLSAYYQQQLKWSRGVFELLVTSYPKLFLKFTWQQKLHYGVIPLHYVSGFIFLINFLIPIISLFFDITPMHMDIANFGFKLLPLVTAIVLIRHYVQWWVMEDDERGFHVVGGLLMIGTWWVFITGIVYTILRKKVPYVPTPKDGQEDNNWILNLPNIAILALSITAIVYGLSTDWNPYNIFMAGFAAMNCFFMVFNIAASRQHHFRKWKIKYGVVNESMQRIGKLKRDFWLIRRRVYSGVRSVTLLIVVLLLSAFLYVFKFRQDAVKPAHVSQKQDELLLWGSAQPAHQGQNIYVVNLPMHDSLLLALKTEAVQNAVLTGSSLLVNWHLDANTFQNLEKKSSELYLQKMASVIQKIDRPVFLRLLSPTQANNPTEFETAWTNVRDFLHQKRMSNLIWVWDIGDNTLKNNLLPVPSPDWLAVRQGKNARWQNGIQQTGLPVMLISEEDSNLISDERNRLKIILANNGNTNSIRAVISAIPPADILDNADLQKITPFTPVKREPNSISPATGSNNFFKGLRGVNYTKGIAWKKRNQVFNRTELEADLSEMKSVGIRVIKHYGPGIYDRNILRAAEKEAMSIHYGFWIPDEIDYLKDKDLLSDLKSNILSTVVALKDQQQITSWNIGNPILDQLSEHYFKPNLIYQRQTCMTWLKELVTEIKKIDPTRPVTLDVLVTPDLAAHVNLIQHEIPLIDAYGLVFNKYFDSAISLNQLSFPYFVSQVLAERYLQLKESTTGSFIARWQDIEQSDRVLLDGIKDLQARKKSGYLGLRNKWAGTPLPEVTAAIKILKPALGTFPGVSLRYHALIRKNDQWNFAGKASDKQKYEWKLAKTDGFGNVLNMHNVGTGSTLLLKIPQNPSDYRLYLSHIIDEVVVNTYQSELHTPLASGKVINFEKQK
jgi:cellulose synthase (UDP-forming)